MFAWPLRADNLRQPHSRKMVATVHIISGRKNKGQHEENSKGSMG